MTAREKLGRNLKFEVYRPPAIKKCMERGTDVWWAEYSYRIPAELRHFYPGKRFQPFKVKEAINIHKSEEYNAFLLKTITETLEAGYSPFAEMLRLFYANQQTVLGETASKKTWNITEAVNYFFTKWETRGLEGPTIGRYKAATTYLIDWLMLSGMQFMPAQDITFQHVEMCLNHFKTTLGWGNRNYNNNRDCLRTVFKMFKKYGIVTLNPCEDVDILKTSGNKHKAYDPEQFDKLRAIMADKDPYTLFASQVVYHLCIRSEKELQGFQVKHILRERKLVFIPKEIAKSDTDQYIPMNDEILAEFERRKIFDYDPEYYVFTKLNGGRHVPDGTPGPGPFGKEFFSGRFRRVRKLAGLGSEYTLYGFKHTRAIHYILDGGKIEELMVLLRHSSLAATIKYLRDLGVAVDLEKIRIKSRKY